MLKKFHSKEKEKENTRKFSLSSNGLKFKTSVWEGGGRAEKRGREEMAPSFPIRKSSCEEQKT